MAHNEASENYDSQNFVFITEDHKPEWTHESVKELLKQLDEKIDMLDTGIVSTQKKMWQLVSKDMLKKNYFFTPAQCENKWKTLKRTYRSKLDRYGSKRHYPFKKEIEEILSKRPQEAISTRSQQSQQVPLPIKIKKIETNNDDDIFNINLNNPPGFDGENESFFPLESSSDAYVIQESAPLVEEISQLKEVITKSFRFQAQVSKQTTDFQQKIIKHLDYATQRENNSLKLQEARIEQQNEIIKQMRTNNSLLQKLLEKIG